MFYKITLTPDEGTWLVGVPALPFVHTYGETKAEARRRAVDALVTGMMVLVDDKKPIPAPQAAAPRGEHVRVSALIAAKVALHNAMLAQKISKYRLGKLLAWHAPQVDRLVDVRHASKLEQLEQALAAVGRRLVVTTEAA